MYSGWSNFYLSPPPPRQQQEKDAMEPKQSDQAKQPKDKESKTLKKMKTMIFRKGKQPAQPEGDDATKAHQNNEEAPQPSRRPRHVPIEIPYPPFTTMNPTASSSQETLRAAPDRELTPTPGPSNYQNLRTLRAAQASSDEDDDDDVFRPRHARDKSLDVQFTFEEIERIAKEIKDETVADVTLSLFAYWINRKAQHFELAKRYVRELCLDQGYNVARISNVPLRRLLIETHDARPEYVVSWADVLGQIRRLGRASGAVPPSPPN